MTETDEQHPLTEEQREIAEAPVEERLVVTAGAGSGKTHVLAARLTHLVDRQGLSAGDEVLVLSFSRAAVGELRRRVALLDADAAFVTASTFDSFATFLLSVEQPDRSLDGMGYEARIRAATRLLEDTESDLRSISHCRHVLVDEVQDLVGPRVGLVVALLRRLGAGFTLFGDPAQAIYDYGKADEAKDQDLYEVLDDDPALAHSERTLHRNFRAQSDEARRVLAFGPRLRDATESQESLRAGLRGVLLGLPTLGDLSVPRPLTRGRGRSKAVLCRTNGQALLISRRLHELGVAHRLQRPAAEKAAAGWLADVAARLDTPKVTRTRLMTVLSEIDDASAEDRRQALRQADPGRRDEVDLRRVADRIRSGGLPEDLNEVVDRDVVVSTIHRAKGLEFDTVAVVEPHERDDDDLAVENRVLYVALTRARSDLYVVDAPPMSGVFVDKVSGRWVRRGHGAQKWRTFAMEIRGEDTHAGEPAGAWLVDAPVAATQDRLRTEVRPGDEVALELIDSAGHETHYAVIHGGLPIGVTSEAFSDTLARALGSSRRPPDRIDRLHVESVDTVAGSETVSRKYDIGAAGLWSRVRVSGLGEFRYADPEEHAKV